MALKPKLKIKNCADCGKIFSPVRNETLCRDCLMKAEAKETEVLEYVRDHQGCSISEVMKVMGVTERFVKNMVNKGLFSNIERTNIFYPCASCGKPIKNGTYCSDCLGKLRKETQKMAQEMAVKAGIASSLNSKLTTIEKLNLQAERELENEQIKKARKGSYEALIGEREGRTFGKPRR